MEVPVLKIEWGLFALEKIYIAIQKIPTLGYMKRSSIRYLCIDKILISFFLHFSHLPITSTFTQHKVLCIYIPCSISILSFRGIGRYFCT